MPPTPFINFAFLVGSFRSIVCEIDSSGGKPRFLLLGHWRNRWVYQVSLCDTGWSGHQKLWQKNIRNLLKTTCKHVTFLSILVRGGTFLVAGTAFLATTSQDPQKVSALDAFLKPFVTAWAILGGPRGSPNRAFWHQVVPKSIKIMSRGYSQKKLRFLI